MNIRCIFGHTWKYCIEIANYDHEKDIDQWITNVPLEVIAGLKNPQKICTVCKKVKPARPPRTAGGKNE